MERSCKWTQRIRHRLSEALAGAGGQGRAIHTVWLVGWQSTYQNDLHQSELRDYVEEAIKVIQQTTLPPEVAGQGLVQSTTRAVQALEEYAPPEFHVCYIFSKQDVYRLRMRENGRRVWRRSSALATVSPATLSPAAHACVRAATSSSNLSRSLSPPPSRV